jgi:hypothetical protein
VAALEVLGVGLRDGELVDVVAPVALRAIPQELSRSLAEQ